MKRRFLLSAVTAAVVGAGLFTGLGAAPAAAADCAPADPGLSTPALLVHGQASSPDVWTTGDAPLVDALATSDDVLPVPVDLTDGDGAWVTRDAVGRQLARAIACWTAASLAAHGPGKVVVVAEGTAGWALRCALDDACGGIPGLAAAVGTIVTIGTPDDGFAMTTDGDDVVPSDPAWQVCTALAGGPRPLGPTLSALCARWTALVGADDAAALVPGSDDLAALPPWPSGPARVAIGAVSTSTGSLFDLDLPAAASGDLVAPAARDDGQGTTETVDCGTWRLAWTADGVDLTGGTCWQGTLAADPRVTSRAAEAVTSWAAAHRCGIDLDAPEVSAAVAQVPTVEGYPWDPGYLVGNFDRCATLSGVSLGIQGATAGSPMQVMLFHRGEYVGTGTADSYRSTYVDADASTDDTVVVDYVYARPWDGYTATASGQASIRFRWDGAAVSVLDELPEYLADPTAPAIIGLDGFGPFSWGDTRAAAETALISQFTLQDLGSGCSQAQLDGYDMPTFGIQDGVVAVGAVYSGTTVETDTGLRIGDPEQRIREVYDDVSVSPDPSDAFSTRYTVTDGEHVGQFIAYDGAVQYMQFGLPGAVGEAPCV